MGYGRGLEGLEDGSLSAKAVARWWVNPRPGSYTFGLRNKTGFWDETTKVTSDVYNKMEALLRQYQKLNRGNKPASAFSEHWYPVPEGFLPKEDKRHGHGTRMDSSEIDAMLSALGIVQP